MHTTGQPLWHAHDRPVTVTCTRRTWVARVCVAGALLTAGEAPLRHLLPCTCGTEQRATMMLNAVAMQQADAAPASCELFQPKALTTAQYGRQIRHKNAASSCALEAAAALTPASPAWCWPCRHADLHGAGLPGLCSSGRQCRQQHTCVRSSNHSALPTWLQAPTAAPWSAHPQPGA